jgi:hypothetical protein
MVYHYSIYYYYYYYYYCEVRQILHDYSQLHVSASSIGVIFRLNSVFLRRQCIQINNT